MGWKVLDLLGKHHHAMRPGSRAQAAITVPA
jgi:hypothetical protein